MRTHSVGAETTTAVTIEPGVGGRIFETSARGEVPWGEVLAWEPPWRLVHTWHPGRPKEQGTEVEILFAPHDDGTEIRGWRRLGADAAGYRENHTGDDAWPKILRLFKGFAEGDGRGT